MYDSPDDDDMAVLVDGFDLAELIPVPRRSTEDG